MWNSAAGRKLTNKQFYLPRVNSNDPAQGLVARATIVMCLAFDFDTQAVSLLKIKQINQIEQIVWDKSESFYDILVHSWGPFYQHGLIWIPVWIGKHMSSSYALLKFGNGYVISPHASKWM